MKYGGTFRKRRYPASRRMGRGRFKRRRVGLRGRRTFYRRRISLYKRPCNMVTPTLFTKLRFQQYGAYNSGIASYTTASFRFNGPYDPVPTAGGGSCTGYPELAAIYNKHVVLASKITIWGYSTTATPFLFYIYARGSGSAVFTSNAEILNKALEYGRDVRSKKVIPYGAGTAYPRIFLSYYRTLKSIEGVTSKTDRDYIADTSTTPVTEAFWDTGLAALDGASTGVTANVLVQITYYVKFFDVKVSYA